MEPHRRGNPVTIDPHVTRSNATGIPIQGAARAWVPPHATSGAHSRGALHSCLLALSPQTLHRRLILVPRPEDLLALAALIEDGLLVDDCRGHLTWSHLVRSQRLPCVPIADAAARAAGINSVLQPENCEELGKLCARLRCEQPIGRAGEGGRCTPRSRDDEATLERTPTHLCFNSVSIDAHTQQANLPPRTANVAVAISWVDHHPWLLTSHHLPSDLCIQSNHAELSCEGRE
mmetsp:Transcript_22674/g.57731  ORF Transcript_22674/g.57731 Transcript_22674/m.57731 type:complete len:233 (-) Transcript_22674:63-761(-)